MLFKVGMALIALFSAWEAVRAIRTGELPVKRSVIRRSETSLLFYFMIGLYLFFAAFVLWVLFFSS